MSEYDDNIESQLDMAVESADDIGDFSETSEDAEAGSETGSSTEVQQPSGDAQQVSGTEPQAQPQQAQPQQPTSSDGVAVKGDGQGNLVDAAGNIVAQRGAERRVYERSDRIQQENNQLHQQMGELQRKQTELDDFNSAPERLGMSREDAMVGMQLMNNLKTSPVETARNILQTAVAQGHSLQSILGDVEGAPGTSVDMGAIKHMIEEKLAPITQREQAQQQQVEQQQRNQENAQQFFRTHEFSKIHVDAITNLMQNNRNMTPEQAYYEVKTYALSQGFDFTQPLQPQVQARRGQQQQPPQVPTNLAPNQPMPNGSAPSTVQTQSPQVANGDDDWDSIVRQSMTESGMQI